MRTSTTPTSTAMGTAFKGYNLTNTINSINLSYDDIGEGGVPIIFIHGFPFDRTMWQPQMDFLKSSNRVIALDLRGFGESKDEDTELSIELFADDLISFMDTLRIDKAIVCGLSMGGYVALNAVKRFPDRFKGLVLADTQCTADTEEAKEKRYNSIDQIMLHGPEAFNEKFIKSVFHKNSLVNKKAIVDKVRSVVYSNSEHILSMGLTALAERSETCSTLSQINIPTLIICGKEDTLTPVAQSESMKASIYGSALRVIENAGHVSNLEQPHVFNKHLLYFLDVLKFIDTLRKQPSVK